jgi:hypothetical protein
MEVSTLAKAISSKSQYRFSMCEGVEFFKQFFLAREKAISNLENDLLQKGVTHQKNIDEFNYLDKIYHQDNFSENSADANSIFDTKIILLTILNCLSSGNLPLPPSYHDFMRKLCKEFNLYGKIATQYSSKLTPITDQYHCVQSYALLSLASLSLFEKNKQYNFFDLALKINDRIQEYSFIGATNIEKLISFIALKKELKVGKALLEQLNANT